LPVGKIFDHGDSFESIEPENAVRVPALRPCAGEVLAPDPAPRRYDPGEGLRVDIVAGAGESIVSPLPGAGQPNPLCSSYGPLPPDPGENAHSLAMIITFGALRTSDLGDLYWNQEHDLVCPTNKLGVVDLYMTTHHGTATSGSPTIVHALHPRVAIMNNGADKGGSVKAWTTIEKSPGLDDLWQLHFSNEGGKEHNVAESLIANPSAEHDTGYSIDVVARPDGLFTVATGAMVSRRPTASEVSGKPRSRAG
jgi:hypothetical protein